MISWEHNSLGCWGLSSSGFWYVIPQQLFLSGSTFRRPCFNMLPHRGNRCRLFWMKSARRASMFMSTRLIYIVHLQRCLCFSTISIGLLYAVVVNDTDLLCSRTNNRTTCKTIALSRSTSTMLCTPHRSSDIHLMKDWQASSRVEDAI